MQAVSVGASIGGVLRDCKLEDIGGVKMLKEGAAPCVMRRPETAILPSAGRGAAAEGAAAAAPLPPVGTSAPLGGGRQVPPPEGGLSLEGQCTATVYIIRHCEKEGSRRHCNAVGLQRAAFLRDLFGKEGGTFLAPSELYARPPEPKGFVTREMDTLAPLSEALGVDIQAYTVEQGRALAGRLLQEVGDGRLCGKAALICWQHENIKSLARDLGCDFRGCPLGWDDADFDSVVELTYEFTAGGADSGRAWQKDVKMRREGFAAP